MSSSSSAFSGGSSLIQNPPTLPYPIRSGTLSWNSSVDQAPTVSVNYEGLTEDQVESCYQAWGIPLGPDITDSYVTIQGAYLRVNSISYSRQRLIHHSAGAFYVYSVSVELGNAHIDQNKEAIYDDVVDIAEREGFIDWTPRSGPRVIRIGEGRSWSFPDVQILQDGANSKSMDLVSYNQTEIVLDYPPFSEEGSLYLREPVLTVTEEGDPNPTVPPPDTYLFRDLSNVFDQGGDRKDWKRTKRIDNQVIEEEVWSYGFVYYGEDGYHALATKSFIICEPARYWKQVGYRKIEYLFQQVEAISLEIEIVLPGTLERIGFLIDPDYEQFAQKDGNVIRMRTRARYLMIQNETGWELNRFIKEEQPGMGALMESRSTLISDEEKGLDENGRPLSYYPYLKFRRVPVKARTVYTLEPTRKYYVRETGEDIVSQPFSIEYTPYVDLPLYLKEKLGNAAQLEREGVLTPDLRVPIVKPDPNYVEPLFIAKEERMENSFQFERDWIAEFTQAGNGEIITTGVPCDIARDPTLWLTMGHSLVRTVTRKPVLGDRVVVGGVVQYNDVDDEALFEFGYTEHTSEVRAEGPKFREAKQKLSFAEQNSLPPEAQYLLTQWVDKKQDPQYFQKQADRTRHYLTTPDNSARTKPGGTLNLAARTIEDARKMIRLQIRKDAIEKIQAQKVLAWWLPGIKPGDTVTTDDLHGNTWIVYAVSWSIEYKGTNNVTGQVFATCSGTQLTLGQDIDREISIVSRSRGYTSTIDPQVKVRLSSDVIPSGEILPFEPSRRRFG